MIFFVGLHVPAHAHRFPRAMVSVRRLTQRKADFPVNDWILDSGAFTQISRDGGYCEPVSVYAAQIERWRRCGNMLAAVAQDYMCEPFMLDRTSLTVEEHQRLTIERYDELRRLLPDAPVMPVLQGYRPHEYILHVRDYGGRLPRGAWVGVGSVCKRNATPDAIVSVLAAILGERPDLRLHGFGVKLTSLNDARVRGMLWSADSMAWSFAARKNGRDANSWQEAHAYAERVGDIAARHRQPLLEARP